MFFIESDPVPPAVIILCTYAKLNTGIMADIFRIQSKLYGIFNKFLHSENYRVLHHRERKRIVLQKYKKGSIQWIRIIGLICPMNIV